MSETKTPPVDAENKPDPPGSASVVLRKAKEDQPLRLLERLKHKEVVVTAQGITYKGILQGADEEEIYLRSSTRFVTVPLDRVTKVCAADERAVLDPRKLIDPEFYDTSDLSDDS